MYASQRANIRDHMLQGQSKMGARSRGVSNESPSDDADVRLTDLPQTKEQRDASILG